MPFLGRHTNTTSERQAVPKGLEAVLICYGKGNLSKRRWPVAYD